MSLIPLVAEGPDRTVVGDRAQFDAAGGVHSNLICIEHLDVDQLRSNDSNASYDLHIGSEYRDHRDAGKWTLPEDGSIELAPGAAVIMRTKEWVHFPVSAFGHVVPKVSLLQQGLSNTSSKVDPGYNGYLLITVFNLGKRTITLRHGDPFCALYALEVRQGVRPYRKDPQEIKGSPRRRLWYRLRDGIERNAAFLAGVLLLAEVAHIVLLAVILHAIFK